MAADILVASLWSKLGLRVDKGQFSAGTKAIGAVKAALVGLAAGKIVQGITGMVRSVASIGENAGNTSQKLGTTAQSIQELGYAAKSSGTTFDVLRMGMIKLVNDGSKNVDASLAKLADRFSKMEDGPNKTRLAIQKLGKAGPELIPLLNKGSKGIDEMRAKARQLGLVLDGDAVRASSVFNDSLQRVGDQITGLRNRAIGALLPAITKLVDGLSKWVERNREVIQSTISKAVAGMAVAFEGLGEAVVVVTDFVRDHREIVESALIGIGIVLAAFAAKAVIAWAVAMGPITLLVAALAGVAFVVRDVVRHFTGGQSKILKAWNGLSGRLKTIAKVIGFTLAAPFIGMYVAATAISSKVRGVVEKIGGFFKSIASGIRSAFEQSIQWVVEKIEWVKKQADRFINGTPEGQQRVREMFGLPAPADGPTRSSGSPSGPISRAPAPSRPAEAGRVHASMTTGPTSITVHAASSDPTAIASAVETVIDRRLDKFRDDMVREIHEDV